jgi:hypothetical protein
MTISMGTTRPAGGAVDTVQGGMPSAVATRADATQGDGASTPRPYPHNRHAGLEMMVLSACFLPAAVVAAHSFQTSNQGWMIPRIGEAIGKSLPWAIGGAVGVAIGVQVFNHSRNY